MGSRPNVFVSYYHQGNAGGRGRTDASYRSDFEALCRSCCDVTVSKSLRDGEIPSTASAEHTHRIIRDNYLGESSVTVVLIGNETWRRKQVDWEIASSLHESAERPPSGLIGILLPTFFAKKYPQFAFDHYLKVENSTAYVNQRMIPERLAVNVANGFAKLYEWSDDPGEIARWIDDAHRRRRKIAPENGVMMFRRDR